MSNLTLTYFNGRGLAETSRLILAIAEEDYNDVRYPLEILCWKSYNFVKEEFEKDKTDGKLEESLNKVPSLKVGDHTIGQSKAIERYLARRFGLMGGNELEAAQIDTICEWVRDFKQDYQKVKGLDDDAKPAGMEKWFTEDLSDRLQKLDYLVAKDNAVGVKTSLADITIYSFITQFFDNKEGALIATNSSPNIKSIVNKVGKLQSVKDWLEKRPDTPF